MKIDINKDFEEQYKNISNVANYRNNISSTY